MTDKWGLTLDTEKQFATPELNLNPVYGLTCILLFNNHARSIGQHSICKPPFTNTTSGKGSTRQQPDRRSIHTEESIRPNCILLKAINGSTLISILTMNGCSDLTLESNVSNRGILTDPHPDLLDL
jgi:hypothetical protein